MIFRQLSARNHWNDRPAACAALSAPADHGSKCIQIKFYTLSKLNLALCDGGGHAPATPVTLLCYVLCMLCLRSATQEYMSITVMFMVDFCDLCYKQCSSASRAADVLIKALVSHSHGLRLRSQDVLASVMPPVQKKQELKSPISTTSCLTSSG